MAARTPTLTRGLLARSRVIARGRRIRDVGRLVERYGGRPSRWVKKSSAPVEGADGWIEYHWYEHPGIGRVEVKTLRVSEP